ncbi:MAG: tRNA (adenine-N1)-methyltransferase [archaeon]
MVELGESFLIVDEQTRDAFLSRLSAKTRIQTGHGFVDAERLSKSSFGETIQSSTRDNFILLRPELPDFIEKLRRGPQIITIKDISSIAGYCGVSPGKKVVEGGGGSGAATIFLANLVGSEGKVHTYEIREDFFSLVRDNLERSGLSGRVELKLADVYAGIVEENVDVVLLDVPEPWRAAGHAHSALKLGGFFACYLPTANQVERLVIEQEFFKEFRVFTIIEYDWQVKLGATRPKNTGLVHTGFICIARKL